ncbi:TPA: hypothetical protein ACQJYA_005800, partial [Klebsiella variicola]
FPQHFFDKTYLDSLPAGAHYAASVWHTDLMKAVLVKQSSFQALSLDTLLHEPPPKCPISPHLQAGHVCHPMWLKKN